MIFKDEIMLEPGIHKASLVEVKSEFGKTDRREKMIESLEVWIGYFQNKIGNDNILGLYIDGSFATNIDILTGVDARPEDIDVIVELRSEDILEANRLDICEVYDYTLDIKYTYPDDEWNSIWWTAFENVNLKDRHIYNKNDKKGYIELVDWRKP